MGAVESIPNPDARTLRTMEFANIKLSDVGKFWKRFRKFDKNLSGTIDIDEFYNLIHESRSIFGDGIFELIDVNHSGSLDFGEFFQAVVTYCLFEKNEVLKFCFYIFDRDKNGYIEVWIALCEQRARPQRVQPRRFHAGDCLERGQLDARPLGRGEACGVVEEAEHLS